MTCKEFEELSGAFVLGAVTAEEREAARAHLVQCMACARLYQELRSVVALLPLSVPEVSPSPALKDRVLAAIRREAEISARSTEHMRAVDLRPGRGPRRRSWATRLLAVAAVLLLTLLGGMSLLTFSLQQQLASTGARLANVGQQLAATEGQLADVKQQLTRVSPQPLATITGNAQMRGATGQLFYLPQQDITVLLMHGLPQLQGTYVYQGWLLSLQGKKITSIKSVGLLTMEGSTAIVSFPGNVTNYNTAAISREPGPSPSLKGPAGPVVALGAVNG
jgi:anti-sigma-K factor RskA